jgi:integrative and conjugative element protein (TIGR02256 family)
VSTASLLEVPLGGPDWVAGADIVIDATASTSVSGLLEQRRWTSEVRAVPVVSMAIGHDARRGMVVLSLPEHTGGPLDVSRRLKLEACNQAVLSGFRDEFWPAERRPFFQPEPGCSDATFVGSSGDVAGLAALMLNLAAADLAAPPDKAAATGHFLVQPHAAGAGGCPSASFAWRPDHVSVDVHAGYQIRISPTAWAEMRSGIARSRDAVGPEVETGGLLFGERDDSAGVLWVSEVSGPPSDSSASAKKFVCGVAGTAEMNAEKRSRTRGSVQYVGMWHTHPDSVPLPSPTDWAGMRRLVRAAGGAGRRPDAHRRVPARHPHARHVRIPRRRLRGAARVGCRSSLRHPGNGVV